MFVKIGKKAEFRKRIIFYCIFAPNYETNSTNIHTSIRIGIAGSTGTAAIQYAGQP